MVIANPIYDTAFKGLIRDPDVAKTLIGTLLETEVVDVDAAPDEHNRPLAEADKLPRCLRLDFCATIINKDGGKQKILIEIQKATGPEIILRFREYLAVAGYSPRKEEKGLFPIVTIYFLGFELKNVVTPCLKVARRYIDMIENKVLDTKEQFVELLTHDSVVIQIPRIKTGEGPETKLEKILSIFEQKDFIDDKELTINYKYPVVDEPVKKMVDILHYIGTDPEERKILDNEAYWRRYEECGSGLILKQQDELAEKDRRLAENAKSLAENAKSLAENNERFVEIAKSMKRDGTSADKISKLTGLTVEEIGLL